MVVIGEGMKLRCPFQLQKVNPKKVLIDGGDKDGS